MVFHQAKAISNLHLVRPLIVMKYFLWTVWREAKNLGKRSMLTTSGEQTYYEIQLPWFLKSENTVCLVQTNR